MALMPMYPGQPNSPQTELAENINETQTTIPLLDASVLPPPPNLAVIGGGEHAETVLYESIDGDNLINCTRGFQGVASSWQAGQKVARNFTAYDYDALRRNLESHGSEHNHDGADPIPDLVQLRGDYEQNAVKTIGDWEMSGELTLHKFNIGNTEWTTTHAVTFGNNSYEKVDIEIPKSLFWGTFEITLTGSFNAGNAVGSITKVIHAGFRENGRIDLNESYYTQVSSLTANHFAISDVIFDSVKDKFVIKIVHRSSLSVDTRIIVKGRVGTTSSLNVLKQITFSGIYTTDTTQYEQPYRTGVIVESGENANGQYVRFADGTQICWNSVNFQDVGSVITYNWVNPAQFLGSARYFGFIYSATSSNSIALNRRLARNQNGYVIDPGGETQPITLYTLSIGRWK